MIPCRALVVVCAAPDRPSLQALRRAAVGAEWELAPGAVDAHEALAQIEAEGASVLVTFGRLGELIAMARERWPGLRIVSVGPAPQADVQVRSLEEVREAILGRSDR